MKKKKEIPLVVLQAIDPYLKENNPLYQLSDTGDALMRIVDSDPESEFYFEVTSCVNQGNKVLVNMDIKPKNSSDLNSFQTSVECTAIKGYFSNWNSLLIQYSKSEYGEDPIVKVNAERFFKKYEILDKDAEYASFDIEQQLFLEEYLNNAQQNIQKLKKGKTKQEKEELQELNAEAEKIKSYLTKESKKKIMKRLSKFWGKAQKKGLPVIREILINVAAEFTKRILIGP